MNVPALNRRAFVAAVVVLVAGCLRQHPAGSIRLGAGDPGGLYLAFAELLAEQVRSSLPEITVDVQATEGSVENLALLRSGELDMGLALADVAERDRAVGSLDTAPAAIARVYENYLQVIVRDSADVQQFSELAGRRISIGPDGSGAAATSRVLLAAAGLDGQVHLEAYRLKDALARLADSDIDALVWSGGVPTPALADLDAVLALRIIDIGPLAARMSAISGFPYVLRQVPTCGYVPPGVRSIGVPNVLLCRPGIATDIAAGVVDVLATRAEYLVPPHIRGLQYLDTTSMIQTGSIPLHPGAVDAYRALHG